LRERQPDISLLVQWFINKYAQKMGKQINHIPQSVMDKLLDYQWPGNVRELENVIERGVILSPDQTLQISELQNPQSKTDNEKALKSLADMEKNHIINVLEKTDWIISGEKGAASILEMHPNTLRSRMSKLGIRRASIAE
jgi:transcriptional regulator with GAF, ATPase, and Fis domain